jgi:hypothetical protein
MCFLRNAKVTSTSLNKSVRTTKLSLILVSEANRPIEIVASNGQFMPTIPVSDAKSLHMNDLMNGTYTLVFKSATETLYTKVIEVAR